MSELTDRMWKRFGELTLAEVPDDVVTVAKQCVLDWFGCALAGSIEPLAGILRDELASVPGPCHIVGTRLTTGPLQAALVNGATGHALDFDDTHSTMGGHPTVPLLPAVLALVEEQGRGGGDLLNAFIVGLEIETLIGAAIGAEHYARGWHQTSTMGVFGAAAASAWLLGLDAPTFGMAMGIAASNSSGLKANFGTMTKPFHAGHAAERGLLAARLAARGFTADSTAIDGNQGLAQAAGSGHLLMPRFEHFIDDWSTPRTLFKYHAACYLTHAGIEATRSVLDVAGGEVADAVTLTVNPSILDVCGIPSPTTGLEAKFSLRGTQALLVHGVDTGAVASFEDGPVNRPDIQAFIDSVTVETDSALTTMQSRVAVRVGGEVREGFADAGKPDSDLGAQQRKLEAKFTTLASPVIGSEGAAALVETIAGLEHLGELSRLVGS